VAVKLDVLDVPVLVVAALVFPSTQLGSVVLALALHVQHLALVVAVRDLVADDAPEHLAVARLPFARVQAVSCGTTQPTSYFID